MLADVSDISDVDEVSRHMICAHMQVKLSWKQYKMEIVTVEDLWEVICCLQNSDIVNVLHDFKSHFRYLIPFKMQFPPKNVAYIT